MHNAFISRIFEKNNPFRNSQKRFDFRFSNLLIPSLPITPKLSNWGKIAEIEKNKKLKGTFPDFPRIRSKPPHQIREIGLVEFQCKFFLTLKFPQITND